MIPGESGLASDSNSTSNPPYLDPAEKTPEKWKINEDKYIKYLVRTQTIH